ncbi:2-dehydro-3-deoxyphosphogluconate aldolase/(4S)-4-hydroxy-2-oxoglutarate aldolase [Maribacter vaceletii]|uniref:2-dehydro-3-deoxyphosphogluconate aldolase/(4S)-4-hydroxy-2-oxoglutarate aldolase n=1 Tax=Maribacter vaceletii TaxID=1206816 RepID=A0A495EC21_9FLAO|nr:bifunctional 4-hydroxy-2-oxoglutarate aldolase/2-dehydro-3-deoxy-phosphogluconate aldolase [Maribacter vaceletii]RKR14410.1 2-dehydro-3-deoxyphosphogluconate aldolase/(4S)-4-hydroxy-2-oxoglutarate aldolase [Maribacter vaceletii]
MKREEILEIIKDSKIVVVIRMKEQQQVAKVIDALVKGGIKTLEVTSNTPGYLEEISKARTKYPNTLIGAGTVTNANKAKDSVNAGAQFLVTPNTNIETIKVAHENNIPVLMGAITPSEISMAAEAGADIVKIFPAGAMGIKYFKAVKAPLSDIPLFAVGGIDENSAADWITAGAEGLGIGGGLTKVVNSESDFNDIVTLSKKYLSILNEK